MGVSVAVVVAVGASGTELVAAATAAPAAAPLALCWPECSRAELSVRVLPSPLRYFYVYLSISDSLARLSVCLRVCRSVCASVGPLEAAAQCNSPFAAAAGLSARLFARLCASRYEICKRKIGPV